MNLRITSKAKNKQITFLIALDNFITKRNNNQATNILQRLNKYIARKKPEFSFIAKEGQGNCVELYNDNNLIAYYA